jgi:hypothetical protein
LKWNQKIIKLVDFIQVKDETLLQDYLFILELLEPLKVINNPIYKCIKKPKTLDIKAVKDLSFVMLQQSEVILVKHQLKTL